MAFNVKSLMVQLPCGEVTVIDREEVEANRVARKYWTDILGQYAGCPRATGEADCWRRTDRFDFEHLTEHVCMGTQQLVVRTMIEARALPALREDLKKRLREIEEAEDAVARMRDNGRKGQEGHGREAD